MQGFVNRKIIIEFVCRKGERRNFVRCLVSGCWLASGSGSRLLAVAVAAAIAAIVVVVVVVVLEVVMVVVVVALVVVDDVRINRGNKEKQ